MDLSSANVVVIRDEIVDVQRLDRLLKRSTGIPDDTIRALRKIKKGVTNGNVLTVVYDLSKNGKRDNLGRLYPQKAVSLGCLERDVRAALCGRFNDDVDMVCAQPSLLLRLAKDNDWACPQLKHYVENREPVLAEVAVKTGSDRERAKKIMNMLMYLGPLPNVPDEHYEYLFDYRSEMQDLAVSVSEKFPKAMAMAVAKKDLAVEPAVSSSLKPQLASCLANVLQTLERQAMLKAVVAVEALGNRVGATMHDGFHVVKDSERPTDAALLQACGDAIGNVTTFAVKPMLTTYVFDEETSALSTNPGPTMTTDDVKASSLKWSYSAVKAVWEREHFKLMDPVSFVCVAEDRMMFMGEKALKTAHQNLLCYADEDTRVPFLRLWLCDPKMRTHKRVDFLPPPLVCPVGVFNAWQGFAVDRLGVASSGDIRPFINHVHILAGKEPRMTNYFLDWLAQMMQEPGNIIGVMLVIMSVPGAGKNSMFEHCMQKVIGPQYYYETSAPKQDLFERFSAGRRHKILLNIDEAEQSELAAYGERIKTMLTSEHFNYEEKGVTPIRMRNTNHLVMTSNHAVPIRLQASDRRTVVMAASPDVRNDRAYFTKFRAYTDDPSNLVAIAEYLRERPVANKDWVADRPLSDAYSTILSLGAAPTDIFFAHLFDLYKDTDEDHFAMRMTDLVEQYCDYVTDVLRWRDVNRRMVGIKFKGGLKSLVAPASGGAIYYDPNYSPRHLCRWVFRKERLKVYLTNKDVLWEEPDLDTV